MQFGIIEYTESSGLREKNGVSSYRHGVTAAPEEFSIRLNPSAFDVIYFTAPVPGTVVLELEFPAPLAGRNLRSALLFELEQRIPVPMDQMTFGYLRRNRNNTRFRVYAMRLDAVAAILEKLRSGGLCCDCLMPAQLLAPENGPEATLSPAELLWRHLEKDPGGRELRLSTSPIPRDLRPVRHRKWRKVFNVTFAAAAVLAVILLGLRFWQAIECRTALQREHDKLAAKLESVQRTERALLRAEALNARLHEAQLGAASILSVLSDLNSRLPHSMHLSGYSQTGDQADIIIKATEIDPNLPRLLLASPLYRSDVKKTVQTADNGAVYNVTLQEIQP